MSQCNMQGFISDEMDSEHAAIFREGGTATEWLNEYLPRDGDRMFFDRRDGYQWIQLVNKNGRLWIEVGEAAA